VGFLNIGADQATENDGLAVFGQDRVAQLPFGEGRTDL